jgi:L-ascorbate metabolism protein UlaG (beta-lactamase superfamily)
MVRRFAVALTLSVALLLGAALLLGRPPVTAQGPSAPSPASQDTVQMEWLGHMFFRFTSPRGLVVLTSPYLANPDSPITLDEVGRVDIILVPNAHGDDMGQAVEIAAQTGARIIAPEPMGGWLLAQGLTTERIIATGVGNVHDVDGIRVRVVHNLHDNNLLIRRFEPTSANFGPALGYIVTFENGFTVYFAASSAIHLDMQLYGSLYKPHLALLNLGSNRDPADLAQMARLLLTDNPNLQTVVPQHHRAGDPKAQQAAAEVQRLGLPLRFINPVVLEPHTFGSAG